MQHTETQSLQRHERTPGEAKREWHPFSWRRMNSRNTWILLAVAVAFVLIGLAIT